MLKEKGLKKQSRKPFSIVYNKEKNLLISSKKNENEIKLFNFKYFSQAEYFLNYLQKQNLNLSTIKKEISFSGRNEIWISKGRTLGEKSFLALQNGKLIGYGFYNLYHQVLSWDKILKLMIPISRFSSNIKNEMQISYLRGDFKVLKL